MEFLQNMEWGAILKIVMIDIMLGVDNAIVIALACASLPAAMRKKAILLGTAGAVGLRAILLVFAGFLMGVPYIKLIAGAYLLFLGYKLLIANGDDEGHNLAPADKVFTAVKTILIADFMMSLDNVLAVAGAAQAAGEHSTMYAIAGVLISIPVIIFGASYLVSWMNKFPLIVWAGAGLLGWVGVEMVVTDPVLANAYAIHSGLGAHTHLVLKALGFLAVVGSVAAVKGLKKNSPAAAA